MPEAYSAKEIALATGIPPRTVRDRAVREAWPYQERQGKGGGKLFPLSALPPDIREDLAREAEANSPAGRLAGRLAGLGLGALAEQDDAAGVAARAAGLSRYQRLSPAAKARADARVELVRMCTAYAQTAGVSYSKARRQFAAAYNAGRIEVEASVRAALGAVSAGSLRNWTLDLDKEGLAGLAGEYGRHRKGTGSIDSTPELREFILGMLTEYPHCSAKHIMRGIEARFVRELRPSLRAVQRWIKGWKEDNAQLHCAISNPDKWRSRYMAAAGDAAAKAQRLNQYWEYDSTKGDVFLADGQRHVVIGVIDIYSRRAKLHVARTSCSAGVCSVTRKALLDWGVPEVAITDNGADYVSKQMTRVFLGLGIYHHQTNPFSPEEKPFVERLFGTFCRDLVELLPGYSGHSVAEAKDLEARRSFAQRLTQKGGTLDLARMSVAEFQAFCDEWTNNIYQHDLHGGLGKTPWQMAAEWDRPVRRLEDEDALNILLLPAPGNDGWREIKKKGLEACGGCYNHPLFGGLEGARVRVLLDDADAGYVYVFNEKGTFLCRAEDPELTGASLAEIAAQRKNHQKKVVAEQKAEMRAVAKRADVKDIVREIRQHRAEEAGKLSRLPQPSIPYSTDALDQAGIAARAQDPPPAVSAANQQARAEAAALGLSGAPERAKPANVARMPEHPRVRWNRWLEIDRRLDAGEEVSEEERRWWKGYVTSAEYAGWSRKHAKISTAEAKQ